MIAVGLVLIAAGRVAGSLLGHTGFGWKQATVVVVGTGLLVGGVAIVPVRDEDRPPARLAWAIPVAIAAMAVLLLWSRLGGLDQGMWHDEVYSVVHYVDQGPGTILAGEYVPNDHVLFNLLSYGTIQVLGESEVTLRLWSVLPALVAACVVVWWAWRRFGPWTALVLSVLIATSPVHHDLASEARGYGLMFLAGALVLVFAYRLAAGGGPRDWVLFGVAGVLGAFTAPLFAVAFAGQGLPLLAKRELRKPTLLTLGAVAVVLLGLYAPLLGDIASSRESVGGGPLSWYSPVLGAAEYLVQPSFDLLAHRPTDAYMIVPNGADRFLAAVLAFVGALLLWRQRERMLCALLVVPVLFFYTLLTLTRFPVHERFGSFLLFHALLLVAIAIVGLVRVLPPGPPRYAATLVATAVAVTMVMRAVDRSDHYQSVPRESFKRVAEVVRERGLSATVTDSTRPDGLQYYFGEKNVTVLPSAQVQALACSATPPPVIVEHPFPAASEHPRPKLGCLQRRGAVRVRVLQRDRGGHIDVWFTSRRILR
jgi:4-amino-4-deoxy-L-arabinose transferase-like glycosyltransferase